METNNYLTGLLLKNGMACIFNESLKDVPAGETPRYPDHFPHLRGGHSFAAWNDGINPEWHIESTLNGDTLDSYLSALPPLPAIPEIKQFEDMLAEHSRDPDSRLKYPCFLWYAAKAYALSRSNHSGMLLLPELTCRKYIKEVTPILIENGVTQVCYTGAVSVGYKSIMAFQDNGWQIDRVVYAPNGKQGVDYDQHIYRIPGIVMCYDPKLVAKRTTGKVIKGYPR